MKVSPNVYLIDTRGLGFEQIVACYLVKGRKTAVVDTGYASSGDVVYEALKTLGVEKIDYIIPTHVHLDHSGGAWKLAERFPDAIVLAHEKAVKHLVDPARLVASVLEVYGPDILNVFGEVKPISADRVYKVSDGETLSLEDVELTFIYTPGHAPHQLSVYVSDGVLITADAVPAKYPGKPFIIPSTPPPSFELEQYIASLRKIGGIGASAFLTPHFGQTPSGVEWTEHLIRETEKFVGEAFKAFERGGGVGTIYKALQLKVQAQFGQPLPVYAESLLKISAMGLHEYFRRKRP
ncbi:MAG: MBL fold metallo-hydrolase [Candidatus Caldarchaeum sp.]|nr:MBL fold metallo-hydrolase [Candidatus Caldarchaeum sp.]MCX8200990.1 MBL fold metallo-hydrolase [Candidatus Caldarchaeum sp.]MDW8063804.1 MBL fold metallo-hydrolase [Candidatus Caldarchaeum sp.]MDW8435306.1 MBL fold metallo-hydrolase [Candidatus Caldarchaeum sp.]